MQELMPGFYILPGNLGCNVYALVSGPDLVLVDSSLAGQADHIQAQIESAGIHLSALRAIVLTHAHGDHTGSAAELARRSGARVLAHRQEAPYIQQDMPLPAASWRGRLLNWASDRLLFRAAGCQVDQLLEDGDILEILGGLHVIHTPGHTPGNICLYQPERQLLFCGDALFNMTPITRRPGLQFPPRLVSLDMSQAQASARRLAELPIQVLCPGHGAPIMANARDQIELLCQ